MLRIGLVIGFAEAVVMLLLAAVEPEPGAWWLPLLDVLVLVLVASPLIYWLVVRPYALAQERRLAEVRYLAHHDELTGLCNRRMFNAQLARALAGLSRHQRRAVLLYLDLNGFKPVNDQHGHEAGDLLLCAIGERLVALARREDVVARLGGDEFAMLGWIDAPDDVTVREKVCELAGRIQGAIRRPLNVNGELVQVGCSIGAHMLAADEVAEDAFRAADRAMYQAKKRRRDEVVFSDEPELARYRIEPIGVLAIDREHEAIDAMLQTLAAEPRSPEGLRRLIKLIEDHFRSEERVADDLGLNMTAAHRAEHEAIVAELWRRFARPSGSWHEELDHIARFLEHHIRTHDLALKQPVARGTEPVSSASGLR